MKKQVVLAMLLAFVLLMTSSCSLIVKDAEVDQQTVVMEVNGVSYLKGEVKQYIANEASYQQYLSESQYGMALDVNDPEIAAQIQDIALDNFVRDALVDQKLEKDGYLDLSAEELAEVEEMVAETYQSYVDDVIAGQFADSELSDEEKAAAAEEWMIEVGGYPTKEAMLEEQKEYFAREKLYQELVADVTVSEEEVHAAYDERVAMTQAGYETMPQYFDMDVSDGAAIYYYPEGYRYVKHILLSLPEEEKAELDELNGQLEVKRQELSSMQIALETAEDVETLTAQHKALEEELAVLEEAYAAAEKKAFDAIQPMVDEVQAKIAEGQLFDELIATYGTDPGMTVEPAMTEGYLVGAGSTNYVTAFRDASMALEKVGDVSEPVRSDYGVHIIRYESDVEAGPVPFEAVAEEMEAEALMTKQNNVYYGVLDAWAAEAEVKIYERRLAD